LKDVIEKRMEEKRTRGKRILDISVDLMEGTEGATKRREEDKTELADEI